MSTSEKEFAEAVKESLAERGVLNKLSGEIRTQVLQILKNEEKSDPERQVLKTSENFVINELIKEYLDWNNLIQTRTVLVLETGHPNESLSRSQLEEALNVQTGANAQQVPLLYSLVAATVQKSNKN